MVRVSLKEAYDDRSVIKKIADLEAKKQDKLTAGQGVIIDGTTISVDTSDLATKAALNAETARLDTRIDDVDAKIPPLASKAELADEAARLDAKVDAVDAKIPPLASKEELNQQTARLDTRIDDVDAKIPPLASKAELADEAARLDAKIETGDRDLSSRIDASNVKIKTNADAIHTIEDELGSDALPGTIYYRIAKVEGDVITLKPLVNDSIKKVDVEGDASTVYHKALHNSGIVENDALPVASDTKAGIMSASMYVGFNGSIQNLQARMAVVEGVGITYQLTGLPDNATSEQITEAFQSQYPNVPLMAGIRVADYDKGKIWQYSGTAWIQLTSLNINVATSSALGLVKGSVTSDTNEGKIFVEVDGSMTVIGWDTLKALATATKQSVDNLEPRVTQQSAKIDALEGDVAANAADITTLKGSSTNHESRISSLETTSADLGTRMSAAETDIDTLQSSDTQQTSKISSLETTSANQGSKISSLETTSADHESRISSLETTSANLGTRMGTAEHDIDTLQASDAQQTSKISALEADMNNVKPRVGQLESDVGTLETKVDQHTQSINGKQDKLTAGTNITISSNNVISATGGGGPQWKVLQSATPSSLRGIYEMTASAITVKKTFRIKVCFGTFNYDGGVHATLGSIEKGVYAIDPNKSVCCVGAGATMVKEGNTNGALFIGWCLSRSKDPNTGSSLDLGFGPNIQVNLIGRDYRINTSLISYDVNVDNCNTFNGSGSGPYTFCIEYLDE